MKIKERHIFGGVLLGTLLILALGMLIPSGPEQAGEHLPWQIDLDMYGNPQVFGITLGVTPVAELERLTREPMVVSLFARDSGERVVEAFFDNVALGGLRAKMVVVLEFSEEELAAMHARGARIATMGSGTRKVTLASDDMALVRAAAIRSITYLPRSRLSPEVVTQRFGSPTERIRLSDDSAEHWLYPHWGLDIALSGRGGDVLQYVRPDQFEQVREPLLATGERVSTN